MTRRWSLRLLACLGAGALVLTGCSEKQEASDALPSSSSAAPTEDELPPLGPEDMPMPEEARTQDAAGAEAFVRYYIDLINRTSTVMDAKPLRDLSDGCRDCDRIATNTEADGAAGHSYRGGEIEIASFPAPLLKESTASIALRINQAPLSVVDAAGQSIDGGSDAYTDLPAGIGLAWDASRSTWLMTDFTVG
ncbi:DUF6318 family protein [Blastococcus sp. TF02A-30]|uniref:DUF6318 family protein n=1 Tax=Blastococcus sp. TF02A-30 TaxID=2250580 RepID=UPI000DEB6E1D|nr:DUF6318 family protein [Blastococcus sp. TF02A-30]RBY93229.1 hypothetical protein DQ241_04280 [Blastococcus sp. TF02A-30]